MKLRTVTFVSALLFLAASVNAVETTEKKTVEKTKPKKLTAAQIMKEYDNRQEPADMVSGMTMTLIDKRGKERVRSVFTARKGKDCTIMWFLSPPDVKGSSFLSILEDGKTNMWIYLPALKKITAITSHGTGKKGYFMGSDFTYEDLEGRKFKDYTYKLLGTETIDKKDCYIIESVPVPELKKPSYSKVVSWVWKERFIPLKEEYYDRMGTLQKIQSISKLKKIKTYWMPEELTMENVQLRKKHKTVIVFNDIRIDSGIDETIFSHRSLTRIFNKDRLYKKKEIKKTIKKEEEK